MSRQVNTQTIVTVVPATPDDTPTIIKIHEAAFKSDMFSHLMLLDRTAGAHQTLMLKSINPWFADANFHILKAVTGDGEIVGWACWVLKEAESGQAGGEKKAETTSAETAEAPVSEKKETTAAESPARVLGGLMHEDTVEQERKHLSGKKCVVLRALATEPSRQGGGIGSQLVQWVTDKADALKLPCWVHASPAANSLYVRAGFEELGRGDYNLAEWAPGGETGNRGWGTYTFRYMLRPAKV